MKYRQFKNDLEISQLGLGCMRFPVLEGDNTKIDEAHAEKMILYAYENGINYFDTAYPYHGGTSEKFVGKVLKNNGIREKIHLTTKNPTWFVGQHSDYYKLLDEQLDNLQTDYLDFYLLHALNGASWHNAKKHDPFTFMDKIKKDGIVKQMGFSFHDNLKVFKDILNSYDWDFCQIQLNYMDENFQAGLEGLNYAASKNIPVVIMEPLKGGRLSAVLTPAMQELFDENHVKISMVELGLKYLFNLPQVSCVLSGASSLVQITQNIDTASVYGVGDLTENEKQLIEDLREFYNSRTKVPCTGCLYCVDGCPQKIPINLIFSLYNGRYIYENAPITKIQYNAHVPPKRRPDNCIECGQCEEHCPQNIHIIEQLKIAHKDILSI
jgi:hypothetical protein